MVRLKAFLSLLGSLLIFVASSGPAQAQSGKVIPMPSDDAKMLNELLGRDVVGKAVPTESISDVSQYFPLNEGTRKYRFTNGKHKGKTELHEISRSKRSGANASWIYKVGTSGVHHLDQEKDGSIRTAAIVENAHAVITRFSPEEPGMLAGFKPGESTKTEISVKVYDLKDLKDVSHEGTMTVTYTYVGAYEVKVPAGTFNAALIKWHFKGKVGPANIEDLQYRFFAKGTGMIAAVDKKNISALLIYHDNSKFGKVLLEK